jgi:hypothetical protein
MSLITQKEVLKRAAPERNLNESQILDLHIRVAIDEHLRPTLTDALMDKLIADEGTLSGHYKTLMDDYVMDALACFTMYEAEATIAFKWTNSGINSINPRDASTAMDAQREYTRNQYLKMGNTILSRGLSFVKEKELAEFNYSDSMDSRAYFAGNMVIRKTK